MRMREKTPQRIDAASVIGKVISRTPGKKPRRPDTVGRVRVAGLIIPATILIAMFCVAASPSSYVVPKTSTYIKTYEDGAREYRLADGSRTVVWPSGAVRRKLKNGTVIHTWPVGKDNEIRRIERPNGTVESLFANGAKKTYRPGGTVYWVLPDGVRREERRDGSVWESVETRRDLVDPEVVAMKPWPRRVEPLDRVVFSGKLKPGYRDPWVCVLLPGGKLFEIDTKSFILRDSEFSVPVVMNDGPGIYRVEIIAKGDLGNRVALNVTIWVGMDPDDKDEKPTLYKTIDPSDPLHRMEIKFHKTINMERKKRDIKIVKWDSETTQLARHMSRDMTGEGYFGHVSPKWGNIAERAVKLFGWRTTIYGIPTGPLDENTPNYIADDIVRARSLGGAMDLLLESPAHRRLLLCDYFTHAGVGISRVKNSDGREIVVVIAMLKLNRPKRAPKKKKSDDRAGEEELFKIYGRP